MDVVLGGMRRTLMVKVSGGLRGYIRTGFVVFLNANSSYPIRNVEDNVPGVSYRSGSKGRMDRRVIAKMFESLDLSGEGLMEGSG